MEIQKFYSSKIASSICNINIVVSEILDRLKNRNILYEECLIFDSKVILNELILNAIKHGNKEDINKSVKISAALINSIYLLIEVEDEGEGYNYNCTLNNGDFNCLDEGILMEGGRGLLIIKCLCDKVKLNKKGNKIAVLKKLI